MGLQRDGGALACIVVAEVGAVLAAMRCNERWAGGSDDPLMRNLKDLRRRIFTWIKQDPLCGINPCHYLASFLEVIRSDETGASITAAALCAVHKILTAQVFDSTTAHVREAMHAIVEAVTSCRFEVTDPGSEEAVLMKILQVLMGCMKSEMGRLLSHSDVCNIVNTCFRVVDQSRSKSQLLQTSARQTMDELVRVIFGHLCDFDPSPQKNSIAHGVSAENGSLNTHDPNLSIVLVDVGSLENGKTDLRQVDFHSEAEKLDSISLLQSAANKPAQPMRSNNSGSFKSGKVRTARDTKSLSEDEDPKLTEPYGVPCIMEIFNFLCSLMSIIDSDALWQNYILNEEDLPQFALGLVNSAIESGRQSFSHHPQLLGLIQDELFRELMHMGLSYNPIVLSMVCSTVLKLYNFLQRHIKLQLEAFFSFVIMRLTQGKFGASYEQQEVATEALVDFCHQSHFMPEMYINFDCNITCSNTFENLVNLLSKSAFPVNGPLAANHVLAVEGLLAVIHSMEDRVGSMPVSSSEVASISEPSAYVPFWTLECENEKDINFLVEFLRRQKHIKLQLMLGADHFNKNPQKGFGFLQSIHLLPEDLDPKSIAYFFRYAPGLDKNIVGDFLGDHDGFCIQVLAEFAKTFDFSNMSLDAALRMFLEHFRLPGEAQKIGRVLDAFAERYYEQCAEILASKDAAFLLSYSVILLNTDQHNLQVKRKMTEEGFIRNLRAVNGSEDFPPEMLKDLYRSVVRDEIRISSDSGTGVPEMTLSRWIDLVHRSQQIMPYISCEFQSLFDIDMFAIMSGPTIAAISVVFDHAENENVLRACMDGFLAVAKISAKHHQEDVIDDLVVSLCKFTTLLNPTVSFENPVITFAEDIRARIACINVFTIANRYGDYIRGGWRNILDCILQLHKLGLFPVRLLSDSMEDQGGASDLSQGRVFLGGNSMPPLATSGSKRRPTGLMSRVSQLLLLESEEPKSQPTEQEVAAHQLALQIIESCHVDSIFSDSKFLQADSLLQLAKALVSVAGRPQNIHISSEDEDMAVFGLELLITITLNNRDRIMLLWQGIYDHLAGIVQISTVPSALVEKAVFGLLRICKRLLPYKEDLADELLKSLQLILKLHARVADVFYERITQEVLVLVRTNAAHIRSPFGWRTISSLLSITAQHPEAAVYGFEALHFIMHEGAHLTLANYILFLDTAEAFAESRLGKVERSIHALDLLAESVTSLLSWSEIVARETNERRQDVVKVSEDLAQMWMRLASTFRKVCADQREEVRNHAILSMQQCLLAADRIELPYLIWSQCFDQVLFVLLDDVLEIALRFSPKEFRGMDGTLQLAVKLLSKIFLHFLDQLILLPNFRALWLALLGRMEMYMKAQIRGRGNEKLQESIPELLKNMLLIMHARGVLLYQSSRLGDSLWELTWHHVDGISPGIQSELFPAQKIQPSLELRPNSEETTAEGNAGVLLGSHDVAKYANTFVETDPRSTAAVQCSEAGTVAQNQASD